MSTTHVPKPEHVFHFTYDPSEYDRLHFRVVKRNGKEVEWFNDEKDANAWILHVFGSVEQAKACGITVGRLTKDRTPRDGDAVVYDGTGEHYTEGFGVLERTAGETAVCFSASAFRDERYVSCSGGPVPFVDPKDLVLVGIRPTNFWRWHQGHAGAHQGGHYTMNVPLWRWNGTPRKFRSE